MIDEIGVEITGRVAADTGAMVPWTAANARFLPEIGQDAGRFTRSGDESTGRPVRPPG